MLVEYARIATVVVDRDVIGVLLKDHTRMGGVTAARKRGKMTAQPLVCNTGFSFIRPVGTILQGQIELPHIVCREAALLEIRPIDVIRRGAHPRRICRCQRNIQYTIRVKIDKLSTGVFDCLLSILTRNIHITCDVCLSASADALWRIDVHRALLDMYGTILLRLIDVLGSRHRTAADIDHAVCADSLQHTALDILNIDIALDCNLGLIGRCLECSQIASVICALIFRIHAVSTHGLHGEITVDRNVARRADGTGGLNSRRIVSLRMNVFDRNRALNIDMGIRIRLDAVRRTRIRIRGLNGQRLFLTTVHNPNALVVAAVDRTGNLVPTVCLKVQTMPVHIDDHRMLLIVRGVIRVECGDNAVALGIRLCSKCLAVIGQRFRFLNRIGRHLGLRRIDIAALSRRPVERNIFDAFAGRRCCQAFGDLRFTCEIAFAHRIGRIPELVGQRIERRADKVLVRRFRRLRIETRAVRRQRDGAVCRRVLDAEVAALHRRRRCRIMRVEYARIAAVVVD